MLKKQNSHTEHLDLWLQRITFGRSSNIKFQGKLCKIVQGETVKIWNSNWLKKKMKDIVDSTKIIDEGELSNINFIVGEEEFLIFEQGYY